MNQEGVVLIGYGESLFIEGGNVQFDDNTGSYIITGTDTVVYGDATGVSYLVNCNQCPIGEVGLRNNFACAL